MKYLWVLLTIVLCYHSLSAQHNASNNKTQQALSGIVKDASGKFLPAVSIYIVDLKIGGTTNEHGEFHINNLPKGTFLVEVQCIGYNHLSEWIIIDSTTTKEFILQQKITENSDVIVTGFSRATNTRQSTIPINIVRKENLLQTVSTNIIDAISRVPGVSTVSTGPAIAKPFIRGLGYNRVIVINDGVRQEGQQWGDEHGIEIDEYSVSKIEVLKSAASVMYGSDALGGVINIITQSPVPTNTIRLNMSSQYQTNNGLIGNNIQASGNKNGLSWSIYGTSKNAHDYKNKYDGYVFNSKFLERNIGAYLGYNGAWGYSHLIISKFDQKTGMIEGERDFATGAFIKHNADGTEVAATNDDFKRFTPFVPYQRIQHFKITTDNSFTVHKNRLTITTAYQRNQRKEFGDADLKTINYNAQLHFSEKNNWRTSIGINGMYQNNSNKSDEAIIPNYTLFDVGGFGFTQYRNNKLTLNGGLRFDNRIINSAWMMDGTSVKFNAFNTFFANISGSIGLNYDLNKQTILKMNVARGFRAPNLSELASNGAHEGTNRYEIGNNNLASETSLQIDAGIDWRNDHIALSMNGFYNAIHHFIFYEKLLTSGGKDSTILDAMSGNKLSVFQFNQNNAYLYGIELNIDVHPHPLDWLHFENTFSYIQGRFLNKVGDTYNLPLMQAPRWISELRGTFLSKGTVLRNMYIKVELDQSFKQNNPFTAFNTETSTNGYGLINTGLGFDIVSKKHMLCSIHFAATNIADVAYQNHLSRLKYTAINNATGRQGVFNTGRNFSLKINIPLEWKW